MHVIRRVDQFVKNEIPDRDVEQSEADDHKPHDRARTECDLQAAVEAFAGSLSRPAGRRRCGFHTEKTAEPGKESAGQKCDGNKWILYSENRQDQKNHKQDGKYDSDAGILLFQISHCPFADITGDLFHPCVSFLRADHETVTDECRGKCNQRTDRSDPPQRSDSACGHFLYGKDAFRCLGGQCSCGENTRQNSGCFQHGVSTLLGFQLL